MRSQASRISGLLHKIQKFIQMKWSSNFLKNDCSKSDKAPELDRLHSGGGSFFALPPMAFEQEAHSFVADHLFFSAIISFLQNAQKTPGMRSPVDVFSVLHLRYFN